MMKTQRAVSIERTRDDHYSPPVSNASKLKSWGHKVLVAGEQLFNPTKQKKAYQSILNYKSSNIEMLSKRDDIALQLAIQESCHTYILEAKHEILGTERIQLISSLAKSKQAFLDLTLNSKYQISH